MSLKQKVKVFVGAMVCSLMVLVFISYLNEMNRLSSAKKEISQTRFDIQQNQRKKKPTVKKVRKKKPRKSAQLKKRARPDLKTALAGSNFGLNLYEMNLESSLGELDKSLNELVMTEETVDQKPRVARRTSLEYPSEARSRGIKGFVTLRLLIDKTGQIEKVKVEESSPSGVFDDVAMASVRSWVFHPAEYQGETVRVWVEQTIRFAFE